MSDEAREPAHGPVGVLVVHGIGEQVPGATLHGLLDGLARVAPALDIARAGRGEPVRIGGREVRFHEVHWADILSGERVRGTFRGRRFLALAWFPLLNRLRGHYAREPYPALTVLGWALLLPLANLLLMVAYQGARLLAQLAAMPSRIVDKDHTSTTDDEGLLAAARVRAERAAQEYTAVDRLLDEYLGDVLNYVDSAAEAFGPDTPAHLLDTFPAIMRRFYSQLRAAHERGCSEIHVVAHSLGTVVAYHALRGLRAGETLGGDEAAVRAAAARVTHLHTIGSPLEKIRFFWPCLRPQEDLLGGRTIAWDNFAAWLDPVAGVIRRYRDWGTVRNHHLLGGGFVRAHVAYERSATFIEALAVALGGERAHLRRSIGQRLRDGALLLLETLLAPAALAVVLAAGAAIVLLTVGLLPLVLSLPIAWLGLTELATSIREVGVLVLGGCFLLVGTLSPWLHAREIHRRYRGAP